VDTRVIETYLKGEKSLEKLFKADAFIFMDDLASKVFGWHEKGMTDDEIKTKIKEYYDTKSEQTLNV
jgi:hypothetical protein